MKVTTWMAALALGAGALAGACGDDGGGGVDDAEVVDQFVSDGASEEEATCLVDELGAERASEIAGLEEEDLTDEDVSDMVDALSACAGEFDLPEDTGTGE